MVTWSLHVVTWLLLWPVVSSGIHNVWSYIRCTFLPCSWGQWREIVRASKFKKRQLGIKDVENIARTMVSSWSPVSTLKCQPFILLFPLLLDTHTHLTAGVLSGTLYWGRQGSPIYSPPNWPQWSDGTKCWWNTSKPIHRLHRRRLPGTAYEEPRDTFPGWNIHEAPSSPCQQVSSCCWRAAEWNLWWCICSHTRTHNTRILLRVRQLHIIRWSMLTPYVNKIMKGVPAKWVEWSVDHKQSLP